MSSTARTARTARAARTAATARTAGRTKAASRRTKAASAASAARRPRRRDAPPEDASPLAGLPEIPDTRTLSTVDARTLSTAMFQRLGTLEEGTPEYSYVRNTLVELNLSLVKYAATRFRNRSEPVEDIIQVGTIGLIKAINRFDVDREVEFASFALPTIVGEIKRFFRDTSWAVRVPRRLQELRIDLAKAYDTLEQGLGRVPTAAELADRLDVTEAEVIEGQQAANGYIARSLDAPLKEDEARCAVTRCLGEEDRAFDVIECLESLKPLIAALPERDRTILSLRFGEELTQSEIGARLGISQMHVSRLLARALCTLRAGLLEDQPPEAAHAAGSQ
ncbi:SigB/SigF/SigG family RNA polymerase sigma factor [Streptomyces sp. A3M-1-3]|uniref:SigB/SigF/SigG family RNA polymerase sigma factor n=1 Tax=Streptomyces sp. A3M-1-3 TaxID=2962044 RepID=UPI0020B6B740|nr:SigB/SigF/SigG family RNA polymerase sigma factor [Streptomyces sp. A3M-1-3]MCP3820672.1 SigB/SigF/SigG family RNA polymerase sigma factor [Streptomyces sp. A3M-1-3]